MDRAEGETGLVSDGHAELRRERVAHEFLQRGNLRLPTEAPHVIQIILGGGNDIGYAADLTRRWVVRPELDIRVSNGFRGKNLSAFENGSKRQISQGCHYTNKFTRR